MDHWTHRVKGPWTVVALVVAWSLFSCMLDWSDNGRDACLHYLWRFISIDGSNILNHIGLRLQTSKHFLLINIRRLTENHRLKRLFRFLIHYLRRWLLKLHRGRRRSLLNSLFLLSVSSLYWWTSQVAIDLLIRRLFSNSWNFDWWVVWPSCNLIRLWFFCHSWLCMLDRLSLSLLSLLNYFGEDVASSLGCSHLQLWGLLFKKRISVWWRCGRRLLFWWMISYFLNRSLATCDLGCFSLHLLFLILHLPLLFGNLLLCTYLLFFLLFNRLHHFLHLLPLAHHLIHCFLHLHLHLPHSILIFSQLVLPLKLFRINRLWLLCGCGHLLHALHHISDFAFLFPAHLLLPCLKLFFHLSEHHFSPHFQLLFHSLIKTLLESITSSRRIALAA